MSSSLSASQLHTVNMRDPLNRVLGESSHCPPARVGGWGALRPCLLVSPSRFSSRWPSCRPRSPFSPSPRWLTFLSHFVFLTPPSLGGTLSTNFFLLFDATTSQPNGFSDPSLGSAHCPPFRTANLFLLISSILGSRTAGPHTQFVQWFMEECVDCLEQGSRGSILQFMPFTTVSASPPGAAVPTSRSGGGSQS